MKEAEQAHTFLLQAKNHPEVIAHRGGNGQWPGETMAAYKGAMSLKVDVLEMDIYLTKDRKLVLMHDEYVEKTTNGKGPVHTFTLNEIQQLNAGYHWSEDDENFPYQMPLDQLPEDLRKDLRVPSLREVLEAFPRMRMVIEMKPASLSPAAALSGLLREYDMTDRVLVASFSGDFMNEFRGLCGEVATSLSLSGKDLAELLFGVNWFDDQPIKPLVLEAPHYLVNEGLVEFARHRGLMLHAWTVNKLSNMTRMKALGVDGIITDYPGPLMALLGRDQ